MRRRIPEGSSGTMVRYAWHTGISAKTDGLATRYDRRARHFLAFLCLAATMLWMR